MASMRKAAMVTTNSGTDVAKATKMVPTKVFCQPMMVAIVLPTKGSRVPVATTTIAANT